MAAQFHTSVYLLLLLGGTASRYSWVMAILRDRRNLKLHLPLPRPASPSLPPLPPTSNPSLYITSFADLETLSVLGHGNGGTVYKVRHRLTSVLYALKVIQVGSSSDDSQADCFLRRQISCEMEILSLVDSPHVVGCHGIFKKPSTDVAFVLEHMDVGSLDSLLRQSETGTLSEDIIARVANQVLRGLRYLHSLKIVHRDIKPANLLVNSKMEVKIADFGVSKITSGGLRRSSSYVGTLAYMSPERFDTGSHGGCYDGFAADVWSLGVTLWELYLGHFPLLPSGQKPDWATLMCAICFGEMPDCPERASHQFRDFLSCCLRKDWSERATVSDLLSHPFVTREAPVAQVH